MMDPLALLGLFLAIVGIILSYIAHPSIIAHVEKNPHSRIASIIERFFPNKSKLLLSRDISLYDILYDRINSHEFKKIISRRYSNSEELFSSIYLEQNKMFRFSDEFIRSCKIERVNPFDIVISVIVEFVWHKRIWFSISEGKTFEVATPEGYFVNLSLCLHPNRYELHYISRIESEIGELEGWSWARDCYFVGRCMPHRYVFDEDITELFSIQYLEQIKEVASLAQLSITSYVLNSIYLPVEWRSKSAALVDRISSSCGKILGQYPYTNKLTTSELISEFEYIISLCHKVIFGESAMNETSGATHDAAMTLKRIWENAPMIMIERAVPPTIVVNIRAARMSKQNEAGLK